jgi:hypothetical protein
MVFGNELFCGEEKFQPTTNLSNKITDYFQYQLDYQNVFLFDLFHASVFLQKITFIIGKKKMLKCFFKVFYFEFG